MSKLIQKSGYFKPRGDHAAKAYMKYIATREGVEKIADRIADQPATPNQKELIKSILRDYPDAKELFEYEDYTANPNLGNASEFITMALDCNWDSSNSSEIYMKYIATRPRVEKRGGHGLFSDSDHVDLDAAMNAIAEYDGNVWTFILSLRREDAARLSYDNAAAWQALVKQHRNEISEALKIPPSNLCWYAAFHNESHHPHIHMMAYSKNPSDGYLNTTGIHKMRSALTNTIFKDELLHFYEQKSASRDELVKATRSAMAKLIAKMRSGICDSPTVAAGISALAEQLKTESGKMQYGYLKPQLKVMVDGIVDELERIPAVTECYEKWRELQGSVQSYYTGEAPVRLPLCKQKEFKAIKNAVIREAINVANGVFTFEDEKADDEQESVAMPEKTAGNHSHEQYLLGKKLLTADEQPRDIPKAVVHLTAAAELGNQYAQYALGKLYLLGRDIPQDKETALRWLDRAAAQGNIYARFFIDHIDDHPEPSALLSATRLLYHLSNVFQDNTVPPGNGKGIFIDSKRRRKLREMKLAAGHAEDEQDSEYTQIMSY